MRAELVIISIHNYKSITYKQVNCALTWRHKIQTTIEILSQTDILSHTTGTKLTLAGTDFIKVNEASGGSGRPKYDQFPLIPDLPSLNPNPVITLVLFRPSQCHQSMKLEETAAAGGHRSTEENWDGWDLPFSARCCGGGAEWKNLNCLNLPSARSSSDLEQLSVQCVLLSWCCSHK